jgi:hypothetical protein
MTRRTALAVVIVLAAAGCQTLAISTPTAVPSAQMPTQLTTSGAAANPVSTAPTATTPATTPTTARADGNVAATSTAG